MISASIVLYNTPAEQLLRAVKSYGPSVSRYLFLIDNSEAEMDETLKKKAGVDHKTVFYIHNSLNIGYGAAHNLGIRKAEEMGSDYHLVMNPDLSFSPSVIDELSAYADVHQDVVYILPRVVYPDGTLQYLCKLLPTPSDLIFRRFLPKTDAVKKRNDRYELRMSGYNKIFNPPCLSGCFMFMRVRTLKEHDLLFDERYFMYCEDFDLMRRLHRYGKTIFYPCCTIVHDHAHESYKSRKMLRIHIHSAVRYFNKFGWFHDEERDRDNQKVLQEIEELNAEVEGNG